MKVLSKFFIVLFLIPSFAQAEPQIEFVLDFSTSMNKEVHGETKSNIALKSLKNALESLPNDAKVSIRTFGTKHSQRDKEKSCHDSELISAFKNPVEVLKDISTINLKAKGFSPLAYSLTEAAKDFSSGAKIIVLFSDGIDTCGGDPKQVIENLYQSGVIVKLFIASAARENHENQILKELAQISGGEFIKLENLETSIRALKDLGLRAIADFNNKNQRPGDAGFVNDAGDYFLAASEIQTNNYEDNYIGQDDINDFFKFNASVGERYKIRVEMVKEFAAKCSVELLSSATQKYATTGLTEKGFETDIFTTENASYVISISCDLPRSIQYLLAIDKLRDFS
ncbi:MAG: hypothetical protein KDD56_03315 [Bdellovibrionales bacterium]|nr:hypothetical protein [Bdellovibrionales bacterium]